MKHKKHSKVFEIIILGALTLVLSLLLTWLVGTQHLLTLMFSSVVISPLIAVITTKYKETSAVEVLAVIFTAVWMTFSFPIALTEVISVGIIGTAIGYTFRNRFKLAGVLAFAGMAYVIQFILINFISIKFYNVNFIQDILVQDIIIPTMNLAMQQFKNNEEEIFQLINSLLINIPGVITITSFVCASIAVIVSLFITKKAGYNVKSVEPFYEFRLPGGTIWVSILVEIFAMGSGKSSVDTSIMIFSNISYVLNFFFMVQGVSLVDFFLKKNGLQALLRVIVYFIGGIIIAPFIFIPILPFLLTVAGVLDVLMDFRKLESR